MGVGIYKGKTCSFRSIGQNQMVTAQVYPIRNGYFGFRSPSTGARTRNISSPNNLATANDFYNRIANGGIERVNETKGLRITRMHDGSIITMRNVSCSDGTPVVEINISHGDKHGTIKRQKIHFVKGEERK